MTLDADPIDEVDSRIVELLRQDGRASFVTLGREVGLSADAVRARMNRLVEDGLLRVMGFVHPGTLGFNTLGAVTLQYAGSTGALAERLRKLRAVTFAAQTIGPAGAVCEVAGHDDAEFADLIAAELAVIPDVRVKDVSRHLQVVKWDSQARLESPSGAEQSSRPPRDEVDRELLAALVENPRATYRELEVQTGQPYWVVRRRTQSLFDDGVVHASAVVDRVLAHGEMRAHVSLQLTGDWDRALEQLVAVPELKILVLVTGPDNATGEIAAADATGLATAMRRLSAVPGVVRVRSYLYARTLVLPTPWRF